jgi:class 3 adenylate cyclase
MEGIVRTMLSRRTWDDSLQMLENTQDAPFQPERRRLSILFTDIQNFTPLFEREDTLELTKLLNRYFNRHL